MIALIEQNRSQIIALCEKHNVSALHLFGSALRSDFNELSDIDFAVQFKETLTPIEYGEAYFGLLNDLKELLERNIDLVSYRVVKNPIFRSELDRTKQTLYAA
jgi:predicted nucleotidyltransferase